MKSYSTFTSLVRQHLGIDLVSEYRFHPVRKWRFDYAIPPLKIAIEVDGGVWTRGRHVRPQGYLRDMEKFNAAASLGWIVLKFTPQQLLSSQTLEAIRDTVSQRMSYYAAISQNCTQKKQSNDKT